MCVRVLARVCVCVCFKPLNPSILHEVISYLFRLFLGNLPFKYVVFVMDRDAAIICMADFISSLISGLTAYSFIGFLKESHGFDVTHLSGKPDTNVN